MAKNRIPLKPRANITTVSGSQKQLEQELDCEYLADIDAYWLKYGRDALQEELEKQPKTKINSKLLKKLNK